MMCILSLCMQYKNVWSNDQFSNTAVSNRDRSFSINRKQVGCLLSEFNLDGICVSSCNIQKPFISVDLLICSSSCSAPTDKILVISPNEIRCLQSCPQYYFEVAQLTYSNYTQCVSNLSIQNIDDYCSWFISSRIWNPNKICNINSQVQLSKWTNYQSNTSGNNINMGVVNVLKLAQNNNIFTILNVSSQLKQAHFIISHTIDMAVTQNALFQQIFVSLFDQVQGSVQNVNVSGRIDIINLNPSVTTNIVISRMFGNVLVPLNLRSGNQSLFQNVSSNIQYYINGNLITQDNQTISGLIGASIRYINSFEEAKTEVELGDNPSLYEMNVATLSGTLSTMVSSKYLYLTQITVTNRSDISQQIPIYTKFDPQVQKNAFTDYYLNAYLRIEEQKHQITNLTKYMFGAQYTVINDILLQNIRFVVFTSETKAVLLKDNSFIKICENSLLLDTVSLTCILRSSCQGYILNATCLRQCPLDHWFVVIGIEKLCYLQCPIHLNYYNTTNLNGVVDPRTSQCLYCSGIARENDCQLECQTQNLFLFSQGCFASCPTGTINVGSNICQSPSSLNQCSNNYISLFDYSSNQYYDICSDQVPSYMYVNNSSIRTVLWMCAGKATINNICDTTNVSKCTVRSGLSAIPVENQSDNSLLCQLSCISGLLNNSNACVNSCPDLYYEQLFTGSCLQCFTNDYDGGQFWSRATRACVSSCNYINLTSSVKACEIPTDLTNCPIKSELAQITQFQCITTECPTNLFIQNDYCRKSCYIPKGLFVQNDNKTCLSTCAPGQYIIVLYPMNVFCIDICPENHIPISQSVYSVIPYEQCMPVYGCEYYLILQAKVCSTLNCVETSGYYEIDGAGNKICNPCNGSVGGTSMKYKIGFICISTPCSFYLNMNSLSCSTTSCAETSGFYQVDGSGNKICNPCNGTVKYKTGLVCSQTPCAFYINITQFTCSNASCAETSGFYEIDEAGNKICNPCDGSQGGSSMKYKNGKVCISTPCIFYINYNNNECSIESCQETSGNYYTNINKNKICFLGCPLGYKVYNGNCYQFCPVNAQFLQINGTECDTSCNGLNIYQVGDQKNCVSACDPQYYLRQVELGYQICVNCSIDKIALRINGQCILKSNCVYFNVDLPVCESGLSDNCQKIIAIDEYIFQCRQNCTGYFEYQNQCYQKCPNNTLIDVTATLCITFCQFYRLITIFGISQAQCQSDVCLDYKYIDQHYHSIVEGCFLICPTSMLQTRSKSCVKDCKIFDVYPNPNYCETPGTPLCYNYRLISDSSNLYICTTCTLSEFINGFECSPNCDGLFVLIQNKSICSQTCGSYPKGYTEEIFNSIVVNVCQSLCPDEIPNYDTLTLLGTQRCFASYCGPNGKFLETNLKCVSMCASGNYFINQSSSNKFQCLNLNQSCDKFYINEGMKEQQGERLLFFSLRKMSQRNYLISLLVIICIDNIQCFHLHI
ncbi:Conserved_hypothetical protein [Hexamita inflata]|uniref:Uncharacterized protein n=1 Tax=Hexamita inflata TaxID=28002 RepID=A0AA86QK25_9EUKA|nr:Conserved hypothetical protein [Hexamita inflata]